MYGAQGRGAPPSRRPPISRVADQLRSQAANRQRANVIWAEGKQGNRSRHGVLKVRAQWHLNRQQRQSTVNERGVERTIGAGGDPIARGVSCSGRSRLRSIPSPRASALVWRAEGWPSDALATMRA
jgi:hypothetical protein